MHTHFRVTFVKPDGSNDEIEGGFTGHPSGWKDMSPEARQAWYRKLAETWGMPEGALIKRFSLCG